MLAKEHGDGDPALSVAIFSDVLEDGRRMRPWTEPAMVLWVAVLLLAVLSIGIAVAEVLSPWRCPWKILEDVVGVRGPAVSMRLTSFDPRRSRGQGKKELEWVRYSENCVETHLVILGPTEATSKASEKPWGLVKAALGPETGDVERGIHRTKVTCFSGLFGS
ncbi:hypothetical protein BU26DRAFT_511309 [Trematosphaeria pertusa]|uniref:Uncharacterized protein n=1 Tax=Trematosphaeria pertusa TaxID=390896 RepID=A0A6A6HUT0_9PLEO|nr:uncharacterized protein BU26DRAFT_511309 [Trematosphaeria pertusa]KAF2241518.1 hypothetical protein BU26DRAFT_511309 [Trematosphaeria pertusa]